MKNDPLVAKLYNKMQQEQNEYRAWLLAQPPEEILNHEYEYSSREDILIALENAFCVLHSCALCWNPKHRWRTFTKTTAIAIPTHWML